MKVKELLELLEETIGHLRIALVVNQQRVFESPMTSYEFAQRAIEIQEDLEDLEKLRVELGRLDPESDVEEHYPREEVERLLKTLELLRESESHVY
ncbi:hypothetical protein [Thermococcus sp.]|uniref:hypothetical protein n=1 Tax=Thermococcus sp. TaxID=35749 RepID=UPI0026162AC3|nr:hypothetical protein [Thermococcus sp.]